MVKIYQAFIVMLLIATINCFSEEQKERDQTIFLELGGTGIFYSLNYENLFANIKDRVRIGFRIGYCFLPSNDNLLYENHLLFYIPFILGKKKSKLEMNLGYIIVLLSYKESSDSFPILSPGIGYRYNSKSGRFNFRTGACGLFLPADRGFGQNEAFYFLPTIYLSFGYSF